MKEKEKQQREREVLGEKGVQGGRGGGTAGPDKEREGKWEEKREERRNVCMCLLDMGNCGRVPLSPATRGPGDLATVRAISSAAV